MDTIELATVRLKEMLGPEASFRPGQLEAIEAVVDHDERVLLVQRTGWGKSIVYFISTAILRNCRKKGPTLLVSPLLSLMRDQVRMAQRIGVEAELFNSDNTGDWDDVERRLDMGEIDLLMISPERLANQRFREKTLPVLGNIGLLVVDEAHCISDWGHDFRPDYRRINRILQNKMLEGVPVIATTATANDRVVDDIVEQLGP